MSDLISLRGSRRRFLGMMGASVASLAAGCERSPAEAIVPYVHRPELVPGVSERFASALPRDGYALGVLVSCQDGRPLKVEGHPEHPASRGATSAREQAALLDLYDDTRLSRAMRREGSRWVTWSHARRELAAGSGTHLLLPPDSSPLLGEWISRLRDSGVQVHAPDARSGIERVTGQPVVARFDLEAAQCVVCLDADPFGTDPASPGNARAFSTQRRPLHPGDPRARLFAFEPTPTLTGLRADRRHAAPAHRIPRLAHALAEAVQGKELASLSSEEAAIVTDVARALSAAGERALVIAGEGQAPEVHAWVARINAMLGAQTVDFVQAPLLRGFQSLEALADALEAGEVQRLVMVGNPALEAPERLRAALGRAPTRVQLTPRLDATSALSTHVVPFRHPFETWGDARAPDGTLTLVQPLLRPLGRGRSLVQFVAELMGRRVDSRAELRARHGSTFEALLSGGVPAPRAASVSIALPESPAASALAALERPFEDALELTVRPDLRMGHGEGAHLAWMHELPDPITGVAWGNALTLGPQTAASLGVRTGDVVRVRDGAREDEAPVVILAQQAERTIGGTTGFGRVGVDLGPARGPVRVEVEATGARIELVMDQLTTSLHDEEEIALRVSGQQWRAHPDFGAREDPPSLHEASIEKGAKSPQWGMSIDLAACLGCGACVVACQAENNVPAVGAEEMARGRRMHWIRIDRYQLEDGPIFQPMTCQHCEKAPCEYVCPTNATTHSPDGINEMTYNRCVGTRFCANNCPYQIRRFNYFDWHEGISSREALRHNPDVTVRARGVMEKCTFCVQRIRGAEIQADIDGAEFDPSVVVTACQQVCPASAIAFGDVFDPESEVSRRSASGRAYRALNHLGTRPRVHYLADIRERE